MFHTGAHRCTSPQNLGRAYGNLKEYETALEYFTSAIEYDSQDAWTYYFRGQTYLALDQPPNGIGDFKTALTLTTEDDLIQKVNTELQRLGNNNDHRTGRGRDGTQRVCCAKTHAGHWTYLWLFPF